MDSVELALEQESLGEGEGTAAGGVGGGEVADEFVAGEDGAGCAPGAGDVAEGGDGVIDGGEHEGGAHGFGAAGEVGDHVVRGIAEFDLGLDDGVEEGEAGIGVVGHAGGGEGL